MEPWKEPDGVVNPPEAGQEQTAENSKVRFLLKLIFLAGIFLVEFSCLCLNTKEEKQHHGNKKVQSNREREHYRYCTFSDAESYELIYESGIRKFSNMDQDPRRKKL